MGYQTEQVVGKVRERTPCRAREEARGGTGREGGAGRGEGGKGDGAVAVAVAVAMAATVPGTVVVVENLDVVVAVVAVVPGAMEEAVTVALAFAATVALAVVMALDLAVTVAEDVEVAVPRAVGAAMTVADGCGGATGEERCVGDPVDHRIPPSQSLCCGCDLQRNTATAISATSRHSDGWPPATVAVMLAARHIPRRRRRSGRGDRRNGRGRPATCAWQQADRD